MHFGFGGHGNQPPPHGAPEAHGMPGANPGMAANPMASPMVNPAMQQAHGIMQSVTWRFLFFAGSLAVFFTAVISILYFIFKPQWAPCSFTSELFLLIFGTIMMILDFPYPIGSLSVTKFKYSIYKFLLFMTRFTGRGVWYLFLSTMCFQALWDFDICRWLGCVVCGLLVVLGGAALYKGYTLSKKLDHVRIQLGNAGKQADSYFGRGQEHLSPAQLVQLFDQASGAQGFFSLEEIGYVTNALSFTPKDDGTVDKEELRYWLSAPGHMLLV